MKKAIIFFMLLVIAVVSFGQQTNPPQTLPKTNYLKKSKNQKTAAWILLGGGAVLTTTGLAIGVNDAAETIAYAFVGQNKVNSTGVILFSVGMVSMAGSIPLFIASGKNKRKAMSISLKNESALQIQKSSFVYRTVPSLNLKINL